MQIVVAHQMDWELHITQFKFDKWHIISACGIPQAGDSCSGADMQATHMFLFQLIYYEDAMEDFGWQGCDVPLLSHLPAGNK